MSLRCFLEKECFWSFSSIHLGEIAWKPLLILAWKKKANAPMVFFGKRMLEKSVICVEKKPCNSSLLFVCKGMFVIALWQKCSSIVCFEENSGEHSLVFVWKRMLVMSFVIYFENNAFEYCFSCKRMFEDSLC